MNKLNEKQTAWQALHEHHCNIANMTLPDLSADVAARKQLHLTDCGILFDFAKQPLTPETLTLLLNLAKASKLTQARDALFSGEIVNQSEQQPALHMAWRTPWDSNIFNIPEAAMTTVKHISTQMQQVSQGIINGQINSVSQEKFTDLIHIGTGGSSLGNQLLYDVLKYTKPKQQPRLHFVETLDSTQLYQALQQCPPATTAVVIVSKSFQTNETQYNAQLAINWLKENLSEHTKENIIKKHCFAVTGNKDEAEMLGLIPLHIFDLPNWVGGRYSICSSIGFSLITAVGHTKFAEFLSGMHAMDTHFVTKPLKQNMPVIYAMIRIWLRHFFKLPYYGVLPYAHDLRQLFPYLQQLEMESNGKSIDQSGKPLDYNTAPLLWGAPETQAQHSIHQWLQQSPTPCPVDFIACVHFPLNPHAEASAPLLYANCLSQSLVLAYGKTQNDCKAKLIEKGLNKTQAAILSQHQSLPGNRMSNTFALSQLNAYTLGALLALYEHATFVQATIWQINPFDQWGVEEGKQVANQLTPMLNATAASGDPSTDVLIQFNQQNQQHNEISK